MQIVNRTQYIDVIQILGQRDENNFMTHNIEAHKKIWQTWKRENDPSFDIGRKP